VEIAVPTIYIDNKKYDVPEGAKNLLEACLSLGFDLPYFCWHPALHAVGACRQCAVKQFRDADDTRGRIVMACMTPVAEGMRLSVNDPEAAAFRAHVVEWLMVNHPHDCPVCDEGGECHLQDMTVMTGHAYRRYRFTKQTWRNQDLGPFVNHEMNRCIECYRCVRFYRDTAGGRDFGVFGWHDDVYFGRHEDGPLESEFSGNLVEICPTGVFTDKTLKEHYTRKWDLQTAPSVCVHCGVGCGTIPGERYAALRRIRNRFNHDVNGYFLCDRGRYGYEFVNDERRIRRVTVRGPDGVARPAEKDEVLRRVAEWLDAPGRAVGIGSPRASLESNFALRALVGPEGFSLGLSKTELRLATAAAEMLRRGPARSPSVREMESADAVLVLGEDVAQTAPRLALALRQSVLQKGIALARSLGIPRWDDAAFREVMQKDFSPLVIATPDATRLDDAASERLRLAPEDIARLGFAVARALDPAAPEVPDLSAADRAAAESIAAVLRAADRPLIVSGPGCGSEAVLRAAAQVAWALCAKARPAALCFTAPEPNTMGVALMGGANVSSVPVTGAPRAACSQCRPNGTLADKPPVAPGMGASGTLNTCGGATLADIASALRTGVADTLIILENDLYRRAPAAEVDALLSSARHVIVIDHTPSRTAARAEVLLPAGTFADSSGTFVSGEGRAQRFLRVMPPADDVQDAWRWLRDLRIAARRLPPETWRGLDAVGADLASALPVFAPVTEVSPPADFRIEGARVPRQPQRYSGRTAMTANVDVHEPRPPGDADSPMSFSMEGVADVPPAPLIPEYWAGGWNSVQALNKFQAEVGGPLAGGRIGRRLLEPPPAATAAYCTEIPAPPESEPVRRRAVGLYHLFGSEELSAGSRGIARLAARPYVALGAEDAAEWGLAEGALARVAVQGIVMELPVRLRPALAPGTVGLPVGLAGMPYVTLPAWAEVSAAVGA
jgi:NADH-quinone oxidoreductase subunit G